MRKRSAALRRHILDTASQLFYEKGVRQVGIDEIIKEAGIARGTLYNHFGSKEQLAREYLKESSEQWLGVYESKIDEATEDPAERLLCAFTVLEDWFEWPNFRGCWITNAMVEMPESHQLIEEARDFHCSELRRLFSRLSEEAGAEHPAELAEMLLMVHRGAIASALVDDDPKAADRACDAARHLVQASLSSRRGKLPLPERSALPAIKGAPWPGAALAEPTGNSAAG